MKGQHLQTLTEAQRAFRRAEYSGKVSETLRPGTAGSRMSSCSRAGGKTDTEDTSTGSMRAKVKFKQWVTKLIVFGVQSKSHAHFTGKDFLYYIVNLRFDRPASNYKLNRPQIYHENRPKASILYSRM